MTTITYYIKNKDFIAKQTLLKKKKIHQIQYHYEILIALHHII